LGGAANETNPNAEYSDFGHGPAGGSRSARPRAVPALPGCGPRAAASSFPPDGPVLPAHGHSAGSPPG